MSTDTFTCMFGTFNVDDMKAGNAPIEFDTPPTTKKELTLMIRLTRTLLKPAGSIWDKNKNDVPETPQEPTEETQDTTELYGQISELQSEINRLTGENEKLRLRADELNPEAMQKKLEEVSDKFTDLITNQVTAPTKAFAAAWAAAENELVFSQDIKDDDPTFAGLIRADLDLEEGGVASAEFKDRSRILVTSTPWGNVVAYQETTQEELGGEEVAVEKIHITAPDTIKTLLPLEGAFFGGAAADVIQLLFTEVDGGTWGRQMANHLASEIAQIRKLENMIQEKQ